MSLRRASMIGLAAVLACGDSAGDEGTSATTGTSAGTTGETATAGTATATEATTTSAGTGETTTATSGPTTTMTSGPTTTVTSGPTTDDPTTDGDPPACAPAPGGGSADVAAPELLRVLADRWEEGWLGSPAVADLDGDGVREVIAPRGNALIAWAGDGSLRFKVVAAGGRIWASPVVGDLHPDAGLEVAFAAREELYLVGPDGAIKPGFPVPWEDELRSLAAGDLDGDGDLELVVAPAHGGPTDVMHAFHHDGSAVAGFPPNAADASGCDDKCYLAGCFDQNLAVGDLDGDGEADVVAPHDNAYVSIHRGSGEAFAADPAYPVLKTPGVRYLHDLAEAMQGYADDEATALQAHFTNTPPAIADLDGDGVREVILLASVQNAAQDDREQGVAVWVVGPHAERRPAFVTPVHAPDYLGGLWDYGNNIVAITNQVSVADVIADEPGLEIVFPGFDGRIHAVSAAGAILWSTQYTTSEVVATGGVVVGDLSGDGSPEIVFTTYSTEAGQSHLFVLGATGSILHQVPLPRRGAMPVPTLADSDGDGSVEILVSLKDAEDKVESLQIYAVAGAEENCLPWPTGRANLLRNGLVP